MDGGGRGRFREVEVEVFGESFDGGFGGVVGRVAGRVGDALFTARDNNSFRLGLVAVEVGDKRVQPVDDAEEVRVEDFVEVRAVVPAALGAYPGVEVEEVEFGAAGFHLRFQLGPGGERGDVHGVRVYAAFAGDGGFGFVEFGGVSVDQDEVHGVRGA